MKQFFGAFFGSILGIVIATIFALIVVIAGIKSSFSSFDVNDEDEVSVVKTNSVLKLVLDGQIIDRQKENPFKEFGDISPFMDQTGNGLNLMLDKIEKAKTDDKIKGIYLELGLNSNSYATLQEIRDALEDFKKNSGKFVVAYGEVVSQSSFYLGSVADKIYLNPAGAIDFKGLSDKNNRNLWVNTLPKASFS